MLDVGYWSIIVRNLVFIVFLVLSSLTVIHSYKWVDKTFMSVILDQLTCICVDVNNVILK